MAIYHYRSKRKPSGGRLKKKLLRKKLCHKGREPAMTKIGNTKRKLIRTKGGGIKVRLMSCDFVNVVKNGKAVKAKILSVLDNPANKNYVRMNIITKGAILETELGKVKVVSRPGQDGVINGILIKD